MFYDTHAHLDYPDFASEIEQVISRAKDAGITRVISIGTDLESSRKGIGLAEKYESVYAAVGWHPNDATEAPADIRPVLKELAKHPKVVAIGETGLDYFRLPSSAEESAGAKQIQARIFQQPLEVAAEMGMNCVIHQRDKEGSPACFEDIMTLMAPFAGRVRGQFHCFAGNTEAMKRVLAAGSIVSFTGIATFKNGQNIRDTIVATPLDQFMLETDSPFLAPIPYRGKRCEPAYVRETAQVVAQVKGCSMEELGAETCAVAHRFFPKLH
ncbi:MAG TPA: TatD family hydrolase [Candidatus Saccharimonadales bacterium]|nr:TatD family hydrolase [Candidatus Saccharimonadales bacterium]